MISQKKKTSIIDIAKESNEKFVAEGWNEERTLSYLNERLNEEGIKVSNWFEVDEALRIPHEAHSNWFWIIRRLRNKG